jgi:hypothetical protein
MTRIKRWLMGKRQVVWSEPALPKYVKINPLSPPGAAASTDGLQPGDMSMLSVAEEFLQEPEEDDELALHRRPGSAGEPRSRAVWLNQALDQPVMVKSALAVAVTAPSCT